MSRRRRLGIGSATQADDGMSLIELVVAMGVFSILLSLVVSMFVSGARSFSDQQGALENSRLASTSMNEVTRVIRAGTELPVPGNADNLPVFAFAGTEEIIINSFIDVGTSSNPPPVRVRFARDGDDELIETRWAAFPDPVDPAYWKYETSASYSRSIARSLTPATADAPTFRFYDNSGAQLTPPAGGGLSLDQIRNVARVQVTMQVQADEGGRVEPVQIQNMVGLPNLGLALVEVD